MPYRRKKLTFAISSPDEFLLCFLSPPDIFVKGRRIYVFRLLGCPVVPFVSSFVCSSGKILLLRYLVNGSNNFDTNDGEYSVATTHGLIRFCRSEVKGQGHSRPKYVGRRHPRRRWGVEVYLLVYIFCGTVAYPPGGQGDVSPRF